jgi:hypothetical protein
LGHDGKDLGLKKVKNRKKLKRGQKKIVEKKETQKNALKNYVGKKREVLLEKIRD